MLQLKAGHAAVGMAAQQSLRALALAAKGGLLAELHWARLHAFEWEFCAFGDAAILLRAHGNGGDWDPYICASVASGGRFVMLHQAGQYDCDQDVNTPGADCNSRLTVY